MTASTSFGPFTWQDPCWVSESIGVPLFGGANVRIQVFSEGDDENAILTADQIQVLQRFFSLPRSRADEIIPHLWRYYQDVWTSVGPRYVLEITDPSRIWDHVHPRFISPDRDEDGTLYVVEAECDWEPEHGVQLVLQNGTRWVLVSDYTGHLTDGRAYGKRFLDDWMTDPAKTLPVRGFDELSSAKE